MRGDAVELHRIIKGVRAVVLDEIAARTFAEIDIAIGEFHGEARRDPIGQAGVSGPREIPLGGRIAVPAPAPTTPMSLKSAMVTRLAPKPAPMNGVMCHQVPRST